MPAAVGHICDRVSVCGTWMVVLQHWVPCLTLLQVRAGRYSNDWGADTARLGTADWGSQGEAAGCTPCR